MFLSATEDPVHVPRGPGAIWAERLLWVFLMSFALDYRTVDAREGASLDQLAFLGLAFSSTGGLLLIGWRYLLVRPGAWFIIFWGGFIAFMVANSFVQGVEPNRSLRIIFPLLLCLAAMMNTHIACCLGIRPSRIVAPVLAAACINVLWRIFHGFTFKDITLENARTEVQSSANNWLAAFIGVSLLLRRRVHWTLFLATGVLVFGVVVTITRSLLFPVAASALGSAICFLIGVRWKIHSPWVGLRRVMPAFVLVGLVGLGIGITTAAAPTLIESWNERLFHNAADRNLTEDISWLTRKAEASALFTILNEDPVHYLYGRGMGSSYYWDPYYMPEIYLVFPPNTPDARDVWFAGHSVWTYAIFSGGIIALLAYAALLVGTMISGIRAARANAMLPGPDYWLAFLPFVATLCLLSETATSNPFNERLSALMFGVMVALPQAFFIRSSRIHSAHV